MTTIAGNGERAFGGDGGPALDAVLDRPRDTAIGPDGSIYVADTFNNRVRKISPDGTITTVVGTGSPTYNGDGIPATEASLHWPHDVYVDDRGVLYVADSNHHRIRRVGLDGMIRTIVGTGESGSTGDDGPAIEARIKNPKSVVRLKGYLYFSALDDKVRRVDLTTGIITTYAGNGVGGYSGDGGPAVDAQLDNPQRLQIDSRGNLYIADTKNHAVRRVDAETGTITTVAGTGIEGLSGDGGPGVEAQLAQPRGIALAGDDLLYIGDSNNQRVRRLDLTTGIISTVAGTTRGYSGDQGPASEAQFYQPRGLTVTADGDLLVADTLNSRLRRVAAAPAAPARRTP